MSDHVKPRRAYRSAQRVVGARATRTAVLETASALFIARGYHATTIATIASQAGVSAETVYAVFGSKASLLSQIVDAAIAGGAEAPAIAEQPWVAELRAEVDPRRRLRMLAREGAAILVRRWPINSVVQSAAAADPALGELAARLRQERHDGQGRLLAMVVEDADLRATLTRAEATDVLYALGSPELCRLLLVDRGWSSERFSAWYADALERTLLP